MNIFLQLDLERPFEEQGNIDIFLHKLTDVIAAADQGDVKVMNKCFSFIIVCYSVSVNINMI